MLKARITTTLILLTLVVNLILFFTINSKRNYLSKAKSFLVYDTVLQMHFAGNAERFQFRNRDTVALGVHRKKVWIDALALMNAVAELDHGYSPNDSYSDEDFFGLRVSVEGELEEQVWLAKERLSRSIKNYIDQDRVTPFYTRIRSERQKQYRKILAQMQQAANGTKRSFDFPLTLIDTTVLLKVSAGKMDSRIWPDERFSIIPRYLEKVDYFVSNPRISQFSDMFVKLNEVLPSRGKVIVYANTYDLQSLTPAELNSVIKYLQLLHNEINVILLANELELY
jgi:hypothetical protein